MQLNKMARPWQVQLNEAPNMKRKATINNINKDNIIFLESFFVGHSRTPHSHSPIKNRSTMIK